METSPAFQMLPTPISKPSPHVFTAFPQANRQGISKMPSMAFFSSQRENAIFALLIFSTTYRDRKGWDIAVAYTGH